MYCNYILLNICIYLSFAYHSHWFTFQNHYQIYYRTISILLLGFLTFQTPQSGYVLLLLHILLAETFQIHRKNRAFQSADPSSPRCLCLLPRISRRLNNFEANTKTRTPSTKVLENLRRVALNIPYLWFTMWYRYIVAGKIPPWRPKNRSINFWSQWESTSGASTVSSIHWIAPLPRMPVNTRILIFFRIGDPELNLHLPRWHPGRGDNLIHTFWNYKCKNFEETSLYGKQSHASPCVLE